MKAWRQTTIEAPSSPRLAPHAIALTAVTREFRRSLGWTRGSLLAHCSPSSRASVRSCTPSPFRSVARRLRPWSTISPRNERKPSDHELLDTSRIRLHCGGDLPHGAYPARRERPGQSANRRDRRRRRRLDGCQVFGHKHPNAQRDTNSAQTALYYL